MFTAKAIGWEVPADKQGMAGFGNFELTIDTIAAAVAGRAFIAGDRFSAADVYVASMLDFMLTFGMLSPRAEFDAYLAPLRNRAAYRRAKAIDTALMPAKD